MKLLFKGTPHLPVYRGLHDGRMKYVEAGGTLEVSDVEATALLNDFPGIFVRDIEGPPATGQVQAPAVDKQIKAPKVRKQI